MESIKLTGEQYDKLLEMCKKLFPEYSNLTIDLDDYFISNFYKINNNTYEPFIKIHWFEFCITWLLKEISKSYTPYGANSDEGMIIFQNEALENIFILNDHPVDYLYEQFKKLK